jgi:hypothetical protein
MLPGTLNACVHSTHLRNSASGCFAIGVEGEPQIGQLALVSTGISILFCRKDWQFIPDCLTLQGFSRFLPI